MFDVFFSETLTWQQQQHNVATSDHDNESKLAATWCPECEDLFDVTNAFDSEA
jgi:hypothetical protein